MSTIPARKTIYVSSRKSQLAMVQTNEVIAMLQVPCALLMCLCDSQWESIVVAACVVKI